ncbi:MAG: DJ-1/PfpI family protein [Aeromicrobium sp.]
MPGSNHSSQPVQGAQGWSDTAQVLMVTRILASREVPMARVLMVGASGSTGAICLAPVILSNAGVLRNRRATVAGTEAHTIEVAGATYTGPGVMVDENIVTANLPGSSPTMGSASTTPAGQRHPWLRRPSVLFPETNPA